VDAPKLPTITTWDTHTATALVVLGALGFLLAIRHGFKPVLAS
jgi:hypothetical protein